MCKSLGCWKDLESQTIPSLEDPPYLMEEISVQEFRELKIIQGECTRLFASTLVSLFKSQRLKPPVHEDEEGGFTHSIGWLTPPAGSQYITLPCN
ncbi:hypothetical protein ACFX19_045820 [Malus domestica]